MSSYQEPIQVLYYYRSLGSLLGEPEGGHVVGYTTELQYCTIVVGKNLLDSGVTHRNTIGNYQFDKCSYCEAN